MCRVTITPMHVHRVEVGIGSDGKPAAWRHVIVGQSIGTGTPFASMLVKNGVDATAVEGTADTHYTIPNFHVSAHHPSVNVPVKQFADSLLAGDHNPTKRSSGAKPCLLLPHRTIICRCSMSSEPEFRQRQSVSPSKAWTADQSQCLPFKSGESPKSPQA